MLTKHWPEYDHIRFDFALIRKVGSFEFGENLWGCTGVDAVVEIEDLLKAGFCCLRLSGDPSVAIIQKGLRRLR